MVCIATGDPVFLGVLSSRVHVVWALATGGRLGVGNDPRYNNSRCFEPFPFPEVSDAQRQHIRDLAEQLDARRKHRQQLHPKLTLTGMYNVLEKLRCSEELADADKVIHEQGLSYCHRRASRRARRRRARRLRLGRPGSRAGG